FHKAFAAVPGSGRATCREIRSKRQRASRHLTISGLRSNLTPNQRDHRVRRTSQFNALDDHLTGAGRLRATASGEGRIGSVNAAVTDDALWPGWNRDVGPKSRSKPT